MARKANAYFQKGSYDESIELYKNALLEHNDPNIRDQLKKAEKVKKEDEAKKYIDPELAEKHK